MPTNPLDGSGLKHADSAVVGRRYVWRYHIEKATLFCKGVKHAVLVTDC